MFCPHSWRVCFPSLCCSDSGLLCRELSDAGPGLHALLRSRPLTFRFSGTPQRRRLGWACVLCPSWAKQLRWPGAWCVYSPPVGGCGFSLPPSQPLGFLGVQRAFLGVPCVYSGELVSGCDLLVYVDHPESQEVLVSKEVCLQFGRGRLSGDTIALFQLWLPSPACLQWGDGPARSCLAPLSPLFCECAWCCLRLGLFAWSQDSCPTVSVAISS